MFYCFHGEEFYVYEKQEFPLKQLVAIASCPAIMYPCQWVSPPGL